MPGLETSGFATTRSSPVPGIISSSCRVPRRRSRSWPTVTFGAGIPTPPTAVRLTSSRDHVLEMRDSVVRRAVPGARLGETAARRAEGGHQSRGLYQPPHGRSHRRRIVLRNEKTGFAINDRLADPRRVGGDHGRRARRSFEIADSPPFLW